MDTAITVRLRHAVRTVAVGIALSLSSQPGLAADAPAPLVAVPGKPALLIGTYDLEPLGYQVDEYFLSGTATSYRLAGEATADGRWNAEADATAPFTTRVVVIRPTDAKQFNGTLLVEWLNVTAGQDAPADWMIAHREMLRRGYAYAAVSAQKVGVEGGNAVMAQGVPLKKADPARYGALAHPGDAFAFDIYTQAGAALKAAGGRGALGPLVPKRVLSIGESQSAAFLTTYVNAVDRLARVYDGFFVHSRFGSGAPLSGAGMGGSQAKVPDHVSFRPDLRVPVLSVITETDLLGARLSGYHASRRADDKRLRVWEVAGAAHADNYLFAGALMDSGSAGSAALAKIFLPSQNSPMGKVDQPLNVGLPHHYVVQAALTALDRWVQSGRAPRSTAPLQLATGGKPGVEPSLALDANGLALGGVRTPWVDVPTIVLSGKGDPKSFIGMLAGSGVPLDQAALARLYPGGKADYLGKFTRSLDAAIRAGHILREDRQEILDIANFNFDTSLR